MIKAVPALPNPDYTQSSHKLRFLESGKRNL